MRSRSASLNRGRRKRILFSGFLESKKMRLLYPAHGRPNSAHMEHVGRLSSHFTWRLRHWTIVRAEHMATLEIRGAYCLAARKRARTRTELNILRVARHGRGRSEVVITTKCLPCYAVAAEDRSSPPFAANRYAAIAQSCLFRRGADTFLLFPPTLYNGHNGHTGYQPRVAVWYEMKRRSFGNIRI